MSHIHLRLHLHQHHLTLNINFMIKYYKKSVLTIPPRNWTPEWTIPLNKSKLQTGWDATDRRQPMLCSASKTGYTQTLWQAWVQVQCCLMSTETVWTIRDGEPWTATSTFTQLLSSCNTRHGELPPLTPSLPWCHLKTTTKRAKFKTFKPLCVIFRTGMWKGFRHNVQHWK